MPCKLCHDTKSSVAFSSVTVWHCRCATLPQLLVRNGLFPTVPLQPHMAVSVDLLAFYRTLFEHSCDTINALASTLHTHYIQRGFRVTNKEVCNPLSL